MKTKIKIAFLLLVSDRIVYIRNRSKILNFQVFVKVESLNYFETRTFDFVKNKKSYL